MSNPFEPKAKIYINYGEIVLHRHFNGIWERGAKAPVETDSSDWRVQHYFEIKAHPEGRDQENYMQYLAVDSDEWKIFYNTLDEHAETSAANLLQGSIDGTPIRAKWEDVVARQYTQKASGEKKDVYARKILGLYGNLEACQAAWKEETGGRVTKKAQVEKTDFLPFVPALVKKVTKEDIGEMDKWKWLQTKINSNAMLDGMLVNEDVKHAAQVANPVFDDVAF